eukprot:4424690-Prymnesium_polylepis.1
MQGSGEPVCAFVGQGVVRHLRRADRETDVEERHLAHWQRTASSQQASRACCNAGSCRHRSTAGDKAQLLRARG